MVALLRKGRKITTGLSNACVVVGTFLEEMKSIRFILGNVRFVMALPSFVRVYLKY